MNWLDLLILAVVAASTATAFFKGILVELFSLGGVIFGFLIAAADYRALASWVEGWITNPEVANLIAFLAIAFGTMILAGLCGKLLRGTVHNVGLGFLDRLLGAGFGLVRGLALVTVAVIALAAFLPQASWLKESRLVPLFLDAAHGGSRMTPYEFGEKIREGIDILRAAQPRWLNSGVEALHCPNTGARFSMLMPS